MMKKAAILLLILLPVLALQAQQAVTYFPKDTGTVWYIRTVPLDSLSRPVDSMAVVRQDSFAAVRTYKGKEAHIVVSRSAMIPQAPMTDTAFISFSSTNASQYINLLPDMDSIPLIDTLGIYSLIKSLENWYEVFKFSQMVNLPYEIFRKDTVLSIDSLGTPIHLRFLLSARRLQDKTINTVAGTLACKRFIANPGVYMIPDGPLPIPIPLVVFEDSFYVAQNRWIVREVFKSIYLDLSALGFPSFYLPGYMRELTDKPTSLKEDERIIRVEGYRLEQNYPNPFNPSTQIEYQLEKGSHVHLTVFDITGREVKTLINEEKPAGRHSVRFDAKGLSGGIYFYRMSTNAGARTGKMTLLK